MIRNKNSTEGETCPLCGQPNKCQLCVASAYKGSCWCAKAEISDALLARVPSESRNRVCICQNCIESSRPSPCLNETRDFVVSQTFI